MPRYAFHLTNGQETLPDPKGLDLPGPAAARDEAMVLAREIREGRVLPGRSWSGWFVEVKEHGSRIEMVPIGDLPEG